jgi:hypothetical protein
MGVVRSVNELIVNYENAGFKHTISYSVDGTTYTTLKVDEAHGGGVKNFAFDEPTDMRYIKFTRNSGEGEGSWFSIWELYAMGARD